MVTAIGIDPGTKSMDLFGFDDATNEVFIDLAVPRAEVTKNPGIVLDAIQALERDIDVIVGPSGYGLPMVKASDAVDAEINAATFITQADVARRLNIVGLRELMFLMKASNLNIWFPPGVIMLPTVPEYRKINRIDMGTADKVFTAVSGVRDQAEKYGLEYSETSFIILEIGFGYTAAMGIENGKIVDGVGGTMGGVGYMGMGAMDGELAYALANTIADFSKMPLFDGGAAAIAAVNPQQMSIEEFISSARNSEQMALAYSAMLEAILKDTYLMLSSVREPREILLSGRFTRIDPFVQDVRSVLHDHLGELGINAGIRTLTRAGGAVKEAAEGAAIIANGIGGGRYESLIETMGLRKSSGGVFSHIYLKPEIKEQIERIFMR
ncbi:MAG TPA: DUF1464 domain-containing protein [Methanomicrobia archaeon]|nr:DUF1464 domain-containing protein [Methanomicrobia archaeon]